MLPISSITCSRTCFVVMFTVVKCCYYYGTRKRPKTILSPVNPCLSDIDESDEELEKFADNSDEDPDFTTELNRRGWLVILKSHFDSEKK